MADVAVTTQFIADLVSSGQLTSTLALQEAVAEQVNSADASSVSNQAWGKPIPQLFGHTCTNGLLLWVSPVRTVVSAAGSNQVVDFAVIIGRGAPSYTAATLLRLWFNGVPVYDIADPTVVLSDGSQLSFRFYDGLNNTPDPTILAVAGSDGTPAFTGTMYVVFTGFVIAATDDAASTTVNYNLPQVRAELSQSFVPHAQTVNFKPFANMPQDGVAQTLAAYDPVKHRMLILLDSIGAIDVVDLETSTYLGRRYLQNYKVINIGVDFNYHWLLDVVVVGNRHPYNGGPHVPIAGYWNFTSGQLLNPDDVSEAPSYNVFKYAGFIDTKSFVPPSKQSVDYIISCFIENYIVDITNLNATQDTKALPQRNTNIVIGDAPAMTDVSVTAKVFYYTNVQSDTIFIGTYGGLLGYVTHTGQKRPLRLGQTIAPMVTVAPGENIYHIYCDQTDSRFVYAVVTAGVGMTLRKYGNFYYFNPQSGGRPPRGSDPLYSDWTFGLELARVTIPGRFPGYAGINSRDRRSAYASFNTDDTQTLLNLHSMAVATYETGDWIGPDGAHFGTLPWSPRSNYVPKSRGYTYYGRGELPVGKRAGIAQPAGLSDVISDYSLGQMFTDLAVLAGCTESQIDTQNLADVVQGMQLNQTVKFTDLINQLAAAFRVDIIETPLGGIKFARRPSNSPPDLSPDPFTLLPVNADTHIIDIDRVSSNELPRILQLSFINVDFGFAVGAAVVRRPTYPVPTSYGDSNLALSIPVVMGGADALYFAGFALFDMWAGKTNFSIKLPTMYFELEAGDFVELTRPSGRRDLCKVTQVSLSQDRTMSVTLSSINRLRPIPLYQNAQLPAQRPLPSDTSATGSLSGPLADGSYVTAIDNVELTDADIADAGLPLYFAASKVTEIYTKTAASSAPVHVGTTVVSPIGQCTRITGTRQPFRLVPTTIDIEGVHIADLPPFDNTQAWRNGSNAVLIGAPGRWELIYYGHIVDTEVGVTIGPVLRGRKGTEAAAQLHGNADLAVWMPAPLLRLSAPASDFGATYQIYGMPPGTRPGPVGGLSDRLVLSGGSQAPFAPGDLRGARNGAGDVTFTWHRRDRGALPADFWSDPPATDPLRFTLSIATLQDGIAGSVRSYTVNDVSCIYPIADQTTDGVAGAEGYTVTLTQLSGKVRAGTQYKGYVYVGH